jgi:hypothetical protein
MILKRDRMDAILSRFRPLYLLSDLALATVVGTRPGRGASRPTGRFHPGRRPRQNPLYDLAAVEDEHLHERKAGKLRTLRRREGTATQGYFNGTESQLIKYWSIVSKGLSFQRPQNTACGTSFRKLAGCWNV